MVDPATLAKALEDLRQLMNRGPKFWPKEEAIQGWFCAALRKHLDQTDGVMVVQELHLGEGLGEEAHAARKALAAFVPNKQEGGHVRFDVVVLGGSELEWDGRNLESCQSPPRLLVEIKALNSAGGLKPRSLDADFRKLRAAKHYLENKHRGAECAALLLVIATACKDAVDQEGRPASAVADRKYEELLRWVYGVSRSEPSDSRVQVALVLRERVAYAYPAAIASEVDSVATSAPPAPTPSPSA